MSARADPSAGEPSLPGSEKPDAATLLDPTLGYRRLDPLPTPRELDDYYEAHYGRLVGVGGRAHALARLVNEGPETAPEREWLATTIHADVVRAFEAGIADGVPRRALDIGSGTGELVSALVGAGWEAIGVEPAPEFANIGRARGLRIETTAAEDFLDGWASRGERAFGGVSLINVLEHLPDPAALVRSVVALLAPGGRLVVRVPNDFNPLQEAALAALGGRPWWIAVPDHVNYFDHDSIAGLLTRAGLDVIERSADFPMELFLLMGWDYRDDPAVGLDVHRRRRRLEMALSPETRRSLGRAWAAAGVGRNAFVVARRPA